MTTVPKPPGKADALSVLSAALAEALPLYGCQLAAEPLVKMARFLQLVQEVNHQIRLVGSADLPDLVKRHTGESVFLGSLYSFHGQQVADLGSGAGFPGIALQIAYPEITTTLIESDQRKARFLQRVLDELELRGEVRAARAEKVRLQPAPELVTVRALDKMPTVPGWLGSCFNSAKESWKLAAWVSRDLAAGWRKQFPEWQWSADHLLPGAHSRVVVIGQRPAGVPTRPAK